MTDQDPTLRPQQVSKYLGIPPSALSRQTVYTIGNATRPPGKRGASAGYSPFDALLIKLGLMLINLGLMPYETRQCTSEVRKWLVRLSNDPRYYEKPRDNDFENNFMKFWLVAKHSAEGVEVELCDTNGLVERLTTAEPTMIVSLYHWLGQEMEKVLAII
jgi:hypothetical protein